ncbi:MAG: sporulation protein YqfD [Clostridiales bacterium]|nr:sporulation protein YqfD [Clostridiales bacterium]
MFKKIFKFITGYVIIEITGKNKEKFISMCLHNFMRIDNIVPEGDGFLLRMEIRDFLRIPRLVYKCGVRVRIISKHGLGQWLRGYRFRYGFVVSGLTVCIFFLIIPHYIWCVEIDGAYSADTERITEILREHGVYVGARKSGIDELDEIKTAIIYGVDGVNWAWLYTEGARARLQIQEETPKPAVADKITPTDIIAACDGYIERADVLSGERRVNKGMTVSAGDILVSGKMSVYMDGYPEKYMYVHSKADIEAETVRHESGIFGTEETLRIKTGRQKTQLSLSLFGRRVDLFLDEKGGFEDCDDVSRTYDWNIPFLGYSGISLTVHKIYEINETRHELSEREVLNRAREQLEERICKKLGAGAVKQNEQLTYNVSGGKYMVELRMRFKENIGMEVPAEE